LAAGETNKALDFLHYYSERRLLGDHVPYPVEAYPEGNQRHLSAESGLYCRVFTEGLFGIRPMGLNSFTSTPRLPKLWNTMSLRKIHAFGQNFDIAIKRVGDKIKVTVSDEKKVWIEKVIKEGESINVTFD
jgi:cellobiose phosphorylase